MATLKISDLSVGDWVRDGNGIIAKEITETYKVQLSAMGLLAKAENPNRVQAMIETSGIGKSE